MTNEGGGGGDTLTVLTIYKTGGVFGPEYVTRLRDGVAKNLTVPHNFVCLTDSPVEGVDCLPLLHDWPGWWSKVEMFAPDLPFSRVLFIDLSSVVTGSLDDMAAQDGIVITRDWYHGGPSQSVLLYTVGDFRKTWDAFVERPAYWMEKGDKRIPPDFGDQVLMNHTDIPKMRYWQNVLPGHLVSFKVHGKQPGARLVKFHGRPKPHEVNWLEQVEYKQSLNTPPETMLENAKANWQRGLPRFAETEAHDRRMILVAGGPSLEDSLLHLRFAKGDVFALNGAHDYLIERNLVPDYMVMLDARPDNAVFVSNPHKSVKYMISAVCDAAVFDALDGHDVEIWANEMGGMADTLPDATVLVGGGATVGMKSMYLGYLMGYRKFEFYGFDSSYRGDDNHAWKQPLNDGEDRVSVFTGGKEFICAPWMAKQGQEFLDQARTLLGLGCEINVIGEGLIPAIAAQLSEPERKLNVS